LGGTKIARVHEKAVPTQAQNWGQTALPGHKNRSLLVGHLLRQSSVCYVLQKPGREDRHRKLPGYLSASLLTSAPRDRLALLATTRRSLWRSRFPPRRYQSTSDRMSLPRGGNRFAH